MTLLLIHQMMRGVRGVTVFFISSLSSASLLPSCAVMGTFIFLKERMVYMVEKQNSSDLDDILM